MAPYGIYVDKNGNLVCRAPPKVTGLCSYTKRGFFPMILRMMGFDACLLYNDRTKVLVHRNDVSSQVNEY